jgi:hypothetical protein
VASLADVTRTATTAYGRDDLERRVLAVSELLANPGVHVVVAGEFKQGKSSLVNALVDADVCPVDDDIATAVPTFVGWESAPSAHVTPDVADTSHTEGTYRIDLSEVPAVATDRARSNDERPAVRVRVGLPTQLLRDGLILVDTPGVGGLTSVHCAATLAALPFAEAMLFVSDASQEFTSSELAFLRRARDLCDRIVCVVTKRDVYPEWRRVVEADREHLRREGIDAPLLVTSSALHVAARGVDDPDLAQEAGLDAVVAVLVDTISADAMLGLLRRSVAELSSVAQQLLMPFEATVAALGDPSAAAAARTALEAARQDAAALREDAARWSTTLHDGMADVRTETQHDLRRRLRDLTAEMDRVLAVSDPADDWDALDAQLRADAAQAVVATYGLLRQSTREVTARVGEHFRDAAGATMSDLDAYDPVPVLEGLAESSAPDFTGKGVVARTMGAARGANSGVFMFRSAAGMVFTGMNPLAAPFLVASVGVGLLMGRRTMSEERLRELQQARAQARGAIRSHLDELQFTVGKHLGDTLTTVQRELRDHYQERSREVLRSTEAALAAAQQAAAGDERARTDRLAAATAEVERVRALGTRATALTAELGA